MDIVEKTQNIVNNVTIPGWSIGKIVIYGFSGLSLILFIISSWMAPNPSSSNYLIYELVKQSSFVYFSIQMIGMCYMYELDFMPKSQGLVILPFVCFVVYMLTLTMAYTMTSSTCEKPKREVSIINSFQPVLGLIVSYILATKVSLIRQGFYDLTGGSHNDLSYYSAIGFWMSASIWPFLTSAYFTIKKSACNTNHEIKVSKVGKNKPTDQII